MNQLKADCTGPRQCKVVQNYRSQTPKPPPLTCVKPPRHEVVLSPGVCAALLGQQDALLNLGGGEREGVGWSACVSAYVCECECELPASVWEAGGRGGRGS